MKHKPDMKYDPQVHHRQSIRLPGYDYTTAGFYFVRMCTAQRESLFGQIVDGQVELNEYGQTIADCWQWLPEQYSYVELDEWILMPNHLHGIMVIAEARRGGSRTAPTNGTRRKPLGRLIGAFKTVSTKAVNQMRGTPGTKVWQRNHYEHVVRSDESLHSIRLYIINNPSNWESDELYSATLS